MRPEDFDERITNLVLSADWECFNILMTEMQEQCKNDLLEPWIYLPNASTIYQDGIISEYTKGIHFACKFLYKILNFIIRRRKNTLKRQMFLRGFHTGLNGLMTKVKKIADTYRKKGQEKETEKIEPVRIKGFESITK